jgi:hypothetical protein
MLLIRKGIEVIQNIPYQKRKAVGRDRTDKGFYSIPDYKSEPIANSGHDGKKKIAGEGIKPS